MTTNELNAELTLIVGATAMVPLQLLELDKSNPRLRTGSDLSVATEEDVISSLYDISAIDELITSICTNGYLHLEPMIVIGESDEGPFRVIEGNRRLSAIKLIRNKPLADSLGIDVPENLGDEISNTMLNILVYRVAREEDARAFIGFKHINGPQRWDAYAKALYATDWYKSGGGQLTISSIAAQIGDNNNTLRSYIYSILILEQVERSGLWSLKDRANGGRFAFSHFYTALGRKEYKVFLGQEGDWSDTPKLEPIEASMLPAVSEALSYIYGSKPDDRQALVRSQNPDLKDVGLALVNEDSLTILRNGGSLDDARDYFTEPSVVFFDALVQVNLKIQKAIKMLPKYNGGNPRADELVEEIYEQADTLKKKIKKKKNKK